MPSHSFLHHSSTKSSIIDRLSHEYPLSAKEVFSRVKNNSSASVSYQAVHKSLKELVSEKVLVKDGTKYSLDSLWIEGLKSFALDLGETYSRSGKLDVSEDHIVLHFSTLLSMLRFIVGMYESRFPNPEKKDSICVWKHPWPVIGFSDVEFAHLRKLLKSSTHYAVCPNSTPLDKMFSSMLTEMGKNCQTNVKIDMDCDVKIHGDYLAQIYFPKEFSDALDRIYRSTKQVETIQYAKLLSHVMDTKTDIKVVIQKNPELAEHFRKMVKGEFAKT